MGGANALLVNLVPAQRAEGHDVAILELVKAKDQTLTNKLANIGVSVSSLVQKGTVYNFLLFFKIIPYLKRYDIVHVHLFPALYWVALAKIVNCSKTPLVYTEHSTSNKRRNNPILFAVDKFVYTNCYKEVIACSDKVLGTFKKAFPRVKAMAISNGVKISDNINAMPYTKKELLNIDENCFVISMVARFASMKRQDTIVKAISRLPKYYHAVFVGGDSGCMDDVKRIVSDLDVADRIHFLGIRSDVSRILKTSDVVMMASDYEGLSLSSIEGMAAGKPFVASNVNGLKEVVSGAGILYENKKDEELVNILKKLYKDKEYYKQISVKCLERASDFDIHKCSDLYLNEYKKYIK